MLDAAAHLKAGDLVAFPTETVYGLGADASNSRAVARIYSVKGRPSDHPLIVHIASIERMGDWASDVPEYAIALGRSFWPGPMTLILKRSELAGDFITGAQDSVGVRVPDHVVALALLEAFERAGGKGVAAPSANRFGHVSPTTATAGIEELGNYLSQDDLVLDGGACDVGVESTIIDCTGQTSQSAAPGCN
jgi:L-threonylcarbamoyladenylate synthase